MGSRDSTFGPGEECSRTILAYDRRTCKGLIILHPILKSRSNLLLLCKRRLRRIFDFAFHNEVASYVWSPGKGHAQVGMNIDFSWRCLTFFLYSYRLTIDGGNIALPPRLIP